MDIQSISTFEVLHNRALQIDIYLLTYLLPVSEERRRHHPMFIYSDTIPACDRQTDKNAVAKTVLSIAACCKNCTITHECGACGVGCSTRGTRVADLKIIVSLIGSCSLGTESFGNGLHLYTTHLLFLQPENYLHHLHEVQL